MKNVLISLAVLSLLMVLALGTLQATTMGDILVGQAGDNSGLNCVNVGWGGWSVQSTWSGVSCRFFTGAASPTAVQITISTTNPMGGTLQVTMYNTGGAPTTVSGYFSFNQGGSWQDSQLQQVTIPVGVWTTVNFEVCSSAVYEALTTFQGGVTGIDATGALGDGLQMWLQFGDGSGGGPPAPSTVAVSEIKSVTSKAWTLQITGQPFDTYNDGGFQLWDLTGWGGLTTVAGVQCRATLGTASPTINPIVLTMDPDLKRMLVTYFDCTASGGVDIWANYANGGGWQDLKIGSCPMTNSGKWRTAQLDLTAMSAALSGLPASADRYTDPSPDFGGLGRPGIQAQFQPWGNGGTNFTQQIPFAMIGVDDQPKGSSLPTGWPPEDPTIADILVGQGNDSTGSITNNVNIAWLGWGAQTTVSGVSCRMFTGAGSPTAASITISTTKPMGGTLQVTMYNTGGAPTTVSAYFGFQNGGTWQDQQLQQVTLPVGIWTTVNFEVCSAAVYEALTTFQGGLTSLEATGTLGDGLQMWLQFGSGNGGGPPAPPTVAVSEIKSVTSKSWTLQITGQPFDTYAAGGFQLWDLTGWSALTTAAGVQCRVDLGTASPTIDPIVLTMDPDLRRMMVTYYDGAVSSGFDIYANYNDGGSWQDLKIGTCPMTNSGAWVTAQLDLTTLSAALSGLSASADRFTDPSPDFGGAGIPGIQMRFQPWNAGSGSFTQQIPFAYITVDDQSVGSPVPVELSSFSAEQ